MKSKQIFGEMSILIILIILTAVSLSSYGDIDGRTGRTRKSSTSGCGGCHGSSPTAGVSVTISGPDTVSAGQTNLFSLVINRSTKTGAGLDIATRLGTLGAVTPNTRVSNGEITHNDNLAMSGGTITIQFNYTAPSAPGTDTIWATGLASNSSGSASGDEWNWSANRRVVVRTATGITGNEISLGEFRLDQNYPNPFNPATSINFLIPYRSHVRLDVFDTEGKLVSNLIDEERFAGSYSVSFNASNIPSGVYYYRLSAGGFSETMKMVLLK